MEPFFNISKSIGYVVDRMDVKSREKVLVYCEAEKTKLGEMLAGESARRGAQVIIAIGLAHTRHAQEPPEPVAEAMKVSDVVFCVTEKSMSHTNARAEALKRGARFGLLVGINEDYLSKFDVSLDDLVLRSQREETLSRIESQSSMVKITTSLGTHLQLDISGRSPLRSIGPKVSEKPVPGCTYMLPDWGEVAIATQERNAEGTIVCDGWIMGIDSLLEDPITLTIKKGEIVDIDGGWQADELRNLFAEVDENAKLVAELGIGIQHKGPKTWKVNSQDKQILGVTHIGFGRNSDIGGTIYSNSHLDCIFKGAVIEFDGKVAIDKGVIKF